MGSQRQDLQEKPLLKSTYILQLSAYWPHQNFGGSLDEVLCGWHWGALHITTPKNLSLIHMVSKKCLSVDQMEEGVVAAGLSGISLVSLVMANSVIRHECYYHPQAIQCMSRQTFHECIYMYVHTQKKTSSHGKVKKLVSEMKQMFK